ncbi:MAG: radical SAM protein [bacterium]
MKVLAYAGNDDIAKVYIAEFENGKKVEFVESTQPPIPFEKKWVLIVSNMFGCPIKCRFCDAGGKYGGKLTRNEIISQIDYLVKSKGFEKSIPIEKFKIQFARMGEPALNEEVLEVLKMLPSIYDAPGLLPSVSTIAPESTDTFFKRLLCIKNSVYGNNFQFQFSVHTTDEELRNWLIPVKKWSFDKMAEYGENFFNKGDRKITLNFALAQGMPLDTDVLLKHFDPEKFLLKITPVNPTYNAINNNIKSELINQESLSDVIDNAKKSPYEVIVSIGELEENNIGSNCGQYINTLNNNCVKPENSYTYEVKNIN